MMNDVEIWPLILDCHFSNWSLLAFQNGKFRENNKSLTRLNKFPPKQDWKVQTLEHKKDQAKTNFWNLLFLNDLKT